MRSRRQNRAANRRISNGSSRPSSSVRTEPGQRYDVHSCNVPEGRSGGLNVEHLRCETLDEERELNSGTKRTTQSEYLQLDTPSFVAFGEHALSEVQGLCNAASGATGGIDPLVSVVL